VDIEGAGVVDVPCQHIARLERDLGSVRRPHRSVLVLVRRRRKIGRSSTIKPAMVDRDTFDLIKQRHGGYASWAVWAEPTGRPKSNIGNLMVLDPDQNATLLGTLRNDVVMIALNLSRFLPVSFGNFHDPSSESQDYKIRYAFSGTPYYGAYMTDLIKGVVTLKSSSLMRHLAANPSLVRDSIRGLLDELEDLKCFSPVLIAFGGGTHRLAAKHVPSSRYSRLVRIPHYSHYISKEQYRERVLAALAA
jgi:hypothetical protein